MNTSEQLMAVTPSRFEFLRYTLYRMKQDVKYFKAFWITSKIILFLFVLNLIFSFTVFGLIGLFLYIYAFFPFTSRIQDNLYYKFEEITLEEEKKNDWQFYYNRGLAFLNLNKLDEALNDFNKSITIDHNNQEVWSFKAACLYNQREYEETLKCIDKTIKLDPEEIYPYKIKYNTLQKLDKLDEAEEILIKIRALREENI